MKINLDSVPSTVMAAVEAFIRSLDDNERQTIIDAETDELVAHHTVGRWLRNNWSLWAPDTPLKRDAAERWGIAHADDISGLIIAWGMALVRGDSFDPLIYCERYHAHWASFGTDSLSAGGWPPPGNTPSTERRG